jgi:hypothetical protein
MAIEKKIKYDMQGGVRNYLGKQKEIKAPLKWQSSPNHPSTELAYITQAEKNLLVKQDLHGSLKNGANRGPSGIMSLNGWGDSSDGFGSTGTGGQTDTGDLGSETANDASLSSGNKSVGYGGGDGDPRTGGGVTTDGPFQKAIDFYNKIPTPFNIAKKVLTNLGPFNNEDFYNEKVVPAGRTNLSYDDYMSARMAGTIDAYGNPKDDGRGGNDNQSTLNNGIAGIQDINIIGEEVIDPTDTASNQDMNFNFGTFSNPIYKKDLV